MDLISIVGYLLFVVSCSLCLRFKFCWLLCVGRCLLVVVYWLLVVVCWLSFVVLAFVGCLLSLVDSAVRCCMCLMVICS